MHIFAEHKTCKLTACCCGELILKGNEMQTSAVHIEVFTASRDTGI